MMNNKNENGKETQSDLYEIHVKGHLDQSWSDWLEGLEVALLENGEMVLCGHIADQASLMGILNKLYGLNLALLSVSKVSQQK
jgi:hypothetical protein